jgi:tRNA(Ile)-lysidine synthase
VGRPGARDHLTGLAVPLDPALVRRVAEALDDPAAGLRRGGTAVVAVSGGADSVALLHLVVAARPDLRVVVAHVRHGLRDDAADAAAAAASARALGLPLVERRAAVAAGAGPEDRARTARYAALREVAAEVAAAAVLVGHTMDDQAETVLLRLARGTGVAGLAAMDVVRAVHGTLVVRPLLGERRSTVRAVAQGWPTIEDPTNADPDQRRARARHDAIPALARLHPAEADVVPLLARLADLARPHRTCTPAGPTGGGGTVVAGSTGPAVRAVRFGMAVDVVALGAALPGAHGELLEGAWALLPDPPPWPGRSALRILAELAVGRSADLPGGVRATRLAGWAAHGDRVVLVGVAAPVLPATALPLGEATAIPGFGVLRADVAGVAAPTPGPDPRAWHAWSWTVDVAGEHLPLVVRGRADAGDRAARRVLQRTPLPLRRQVPLVVDAADRILMAGPEVLVPPASGGPVARLTATPVGYPARP